MKRFTPLTLLIVVLMWSALRPALAHCSGCHRWHSCPSDRGTYVCGDQGYCSQCPDNAYCQGRSSKGQGQPSDVPATATSPRAPSSQPRVQAVRQDVFSGQVVGISDGDTLQVMHAGRAVKVRLHGIDCPEKNQAYDQRAKQFTSEHVFGKLVKVVVHDRDRYGRLVGDVYLLSGWHLNHELVSAGLAWWYEQYAPKDTQLASLQHAAQRAKRGLWRDPKAVPPWTFRKPSRVKRR